ncbi:MAG: peptidoglycan DD-metalloendopeptidase family protein [Rickettsiales bacterium]|nr:peptidoglycan DD-metalloendopeptidase family protein [Rickettsiales bacterium]
MLKRNSLYFAAAVAIAGIAGNACAQSKGADSLYKINKEIEAKKKESAKLAKESSRLSSEIKQTQDKLVEVAGNIKRYERQIGGYDRQLAGLRERERILNRKIEGNNAELTRIIAVFENISRVPKGYLAASPGRIETILLSSILLKSVVAELNRMRVRFRADMDELVALKNKIIGAKLEIHSLSSKVKSEKDKISHLIKSKRSSYAKLESQNKKKQAEIKKLVAESRTIEEFLKKAEALRKKQEADRMKAGGPAKIVAKRFGGLAPLPVAGKIETEYGGKRSGVTSKGVYIRPKAGAQVIAPADSDTVFSGAFYGYKNLLILRSRDGYYLIMGGMSEVYASEGQSLLAGEPVGSMGGGAFYVEVREQERPVNPAKYFRM